MRIRLFFAFHLVASCLALVLASGATAQIQTFRHGQILCWKAVRSPGDTWVMNADGTNDKWVMEGGGAWSSDMTHYAYSDTGFLYTRRANGRDEQLIANLPGRISGATWSPDGSRIAFAYYPGLAFMVDNPEYDIYVVNADGSNLRNITNTPDDRSQSPAWSPDSKQIAFIAKADEDTGVYVINADGTGRRRVVGGGWDGYETDDPAHPIPPFGITDLQAVRHDTFSSPDWSPDGSKIACVYDWREYDGNVDERGWIQEIENGPQKIAVVDVATGETSILIASDDPLFGPAWSPDGARIAYNDREPGERSNGDIFVYDISTGQNVQITDDDISYGPTWVGLTPYAVSAVGKQATTWGALKAR